ERPHVSRRFRGMPSVLNPDKAPAYRLRSFSIHIPKIRPKIARIPYWRHNSPQTESQVSADGRNENDSASFPLRHLAAEFMSQYKRRAAVNVQKIQLLFQFMRQEMACQAETRVIDQKPHLDGTRYRENCGQEVRPGQVGSDDSYLYFVFAFQFTRQVLQSLASSSDKDEIQSHFR